MWKETAMVWKTVRDRADVMRVRVRERDRADVMRVRVRERDRADVMRVRVRERMGLM
jgi:hypothetical protein